MKTPKILFRGENACPNFLEVGCKEKNADKSFLIQPIFWAEAPH